MSLVHPSFDVADRNISARALKNYLKKFDVKELVARKSSKKKGVDLT